MKHISDANIALLFDKCKIFEVKSLNPVKIRVLAIYFDIRVVN